MGHLDLTQTAYFTTDDGADNAPTLQAFGSHGTWNGFSVPLATADQVRDFIARSAANDRNGDWSSLTVEEWRDGHHEYVSVNRVIGEDVDTADTWEASGHTDDGDAVYALDGWCWVEVPACPECHVSNALERTAPTDERGAHLRCTYCRFTA